MYSSSLADTSLREKNAPLTDSKQQALLKALGHDPQTLEILLLGSDLTLDEALMAMQSLIDTGRVAQMPGGLYQQLC